MTDNILETPPQQQTSQPKTQSSSEKSKGKTLLQYANHLLVTCGFKPFQQKSIEAATLLDRLLTVLNSYQQNKQYYTEVETRMSVLQQDYENINLQMAKTNYKLEQSEREVDDLRAKLKVITAQVNEAKDETFKAKEEVKNVKNSFTHFKNQYLHEIRKKENEIEKLKQSYSKAVGLTKDLNINFVVLNDQVKSVGKQNGRLELGALNVSEELKEELQERANELVEEILSLKNCLYDFYVRLRMMFKVEVNEEQLNNGEEISKKQFFLPFHLIQDDIKAEILKLIEMMKVLEEEMIKKQEKITEMKEIIDKQQVLLKVAAEAELKVCEIKEHFLEQQEMQSKPSELELAEKEKYTQMKQFLEEEEGRLNEMKMKLEADRKNFTDAAIRLGKERALLEEEKEILEREKKSLETQQLLKNLPTTPTWLKESFARVNELKEHYKTPCKPNSSLKHNVTFDAQISEIIPNKPQVEAADKENQDAGNVVTSTPASKGEISQPDSINRLLTKSF